MAAIEAITGGVLAPSPGEPNPHPNFGVASTPLAAGRVRMTAKGSTQPIDAWVDGPVLPTDSGYGGWVVIPREGREGTVEYQGVEPKRWVLPIKLDGWADGTNLQADWDAILALAELQGSKPPPRVLFSGTVPPALSKRAWLIEKPDFGTEQLVDSNNRLLRGQITLNLLAPNSATDIASPVRQAIAKGNSKSVRSIHARRGDTFVSIAARALGDPERWREISSLNGGRQPDNVKAGELIRLPAK
jgi:nucleoid-associated protein YgaU